MQSFDTGKLSTLQNDFQYCLSLSTQLEDLLHQISYQQQIFPMNTYLQNLTKTQQQLHTKIIESVQYFQTSYKCYKRSENQIQKVAENLSSLSSPKIPTPFVSIPKPTNTNVKSDVMNIRHRVHSSLDKNGNLIDFVKNGFCVGVFAGFDAWRLQVDKNMKYLKAGADIKVGSASASGDVKATLFQDGKIKPNLQLKAKVNATLAQAGLYAQIGNQYIHALGEANVKVGTASAEAKAILNTDEFIFKANVGAAAVKGEVKGTISIFGIKISATGTGELGSIGAGAEFSSKKGEFEFGGKISMIAGLGFKIKVDY